MSWVREREEKSDDDDWNIRTSDEGEVKRSENLTRWTLSLELQSEDFQMQWSNKN